MYLGCFLSTSLKEDILHKKIKTETKKKTDVW